MRTQMLRHLGSIIGSGTKVGDHGAKLIAAYLARPDQDLPPPEFSWHEYTVFLLSMAAEIEHALMVQYLYAGWSFGGDQVPVEHREDVANWQRIVLGVAKEEMGHLVTVQNLLKLLGGAIHLDREDFPWSSGFYPYAFRLAPATRETVAKYVVAESPAVWPDTVPAPERAEIEHLATTDAGSQVIRVGDLYAQIIHIVKDPAKLPDGLFREETYDHQATFDSWGRGYAAGARGSTPTTTPDVLVMRAGNRAQALNALEAVAEQGEATELISADSEDSHFSRFLKVWRGLNATDGWSPSLAVPIDPVAPGLGSELKGATIITNRESAAWATLFNIRYRMLLTWLAHALQADDQASAQPGRRGMALNRTFNEMYHLKAIAGLLVRRPLGDDPSKLAAPPFQMPYTLNFPYRERDFWQLHLDLIDASAAAIIRLPATGRDGQSFLAALSGADAQSKADITVILTEASR
ncbi:ferritin-like domain-containing protein [Rhizobium sp. ICMP 5592]|uniref:ferritin-like domain-containing protein n=1 Tax=Rhizobium sp. ICMP 5592 TaxID=2292445 RepID=UPI001296915B|nr:ferritin-like domain-containing protein [Rhizobium sp. ICMP 5592]MQB46512.1 hypothetical protein [Rhizobium sp. ICMP 5592]